jgi:hypothetical protein
LRRGGGVRAIVKFRCSFVAGTMRLGPLPRH